jgi:hypothetical protein
MEVTLAPTPGATAAGPEADAFEAPRFGIYPVGEYENLWFEVEIDPGETAVLTVGIQNSGSVPASLRTYAANAFNPPNGGFGAATEEEAPIGPTLWVDYPAETFDLDPGEDRNQDFEVTVPEGTPAGEYVVGLVAQTSESLEIPGSDTLRQIIRNTVSVEITVPGKMTSGFELGAPDVSASGAQWALEIPITNTGTARVRPQGQIIVATPDGKEVVTSPVKMGSVYGGNTSSIQITLPGQLPPGDYRVSIELGDEATGAEASFNEAPVTLAVVAEEEVQTFVVDPVSVAPNADPVQFANVAATITNNGEAIPTANVTLNVQRDGEEVESYPLAQNQALPQGSTDFAQRYIPLDGWQEGTYTFQLVIASMNGGTETVLATVDVVNEIVVP